VAGAATPKVVTMALENPLERAAAVDIVQWKRMG
jgi:hypothetical protein